MTLDIPACNAQCEKSCLLYLQQTGEYHTPLRCPFGLSVWEIIVLKRGLGLWYRLETWRRRSEPQRAIPLREMPLEGLWID